jgi:16S rRNA (uracil1498-N3)-methyltransferase
VEIRGYAVNVILFESREIDDDGTVCLDGPRAEHIAHVLKSAPGDEIRVGVLGGPRGVGTIVALREGAVYLRCLLEPVPPPVPRVDLLLALPRPKVMRRLWAQLAALGVGQIILTNAARVERNYFDTHVLGAACYIPLLIDGLQQAGDTRLPSVSIHRRFKVLVEDELDGLFASGLRVAAQPAAHASLLTAVQEHVGHRVLLAVGPEGGWTSFELGLLSARGFLQAGAGIRTLRTDTACIALLALVHQALSAR